MLSSHKSSFPGADVGLTVLCDCSGEKFGVKNELSNVRCLLPSTLATSSGHPLGWEGYQKTWCEPRFSLIIVFLGRHCVFPQYLPL